MKNYKLNFNWFGKYKLSQVQNNVTIDMENYKAKVINLIRDVMQKDEERKIRLNGYKFDISKLRSDLQEIKFPDINRIMTLVSTKDDNQIYQAIKEIRNFNTDYHNFELNDKIRNIWKNLYDYWDSLNQNDYWNEDTFQENVNNIFSNTMINMEKIKEIVSQAISRVENWNNSRITISINDVGDLSEPVNGAYVYIGDPSSRIGFALYIENTKIEIDDVLDGGDQDFFTDSKIESDYFNLIKEITKPNSSKTGKFVTLYTARPTSDRDLYQNATEIPKNIFLTNKFDSAYGIGKDFGNRDIWKVIVNERYLIMTLNSPSERQYQVVGDASIPIRLMELLDSV